MGQGEPLNAIISGNSDSRVLQDAEVDGGLRNYFLCVFRHCLCRCVEMLSIVLSSPLDLSASLESVLGNIQARTKRLILEMATVIVSWFLLYFYILGLRGPVS